jgi:hypothetical protein
MDKQFAMMTDSQISQSENPCAGDFPKLRDTGSQVVKSVRLRPCGHFVFIGDNNNRLKTLVYFEVPSDILRK